MIYSRLQCRGGNIVYFHVYCNDLLPMVMLVGRYRQHVKSCKRSMIHSNTQRKNPLKCKGNFTKVFILTMDERCHL